MAPTIHLYMTPGACSLATHIALHESLLHFTITDLKARRGFPVEHLHLNPKGRVPILSFDGELITETPAILSTIAALVPEKRLLGSGILENARAQEWMAWLCGTLHGDAFGSLFRPERFTDDESAYESVKAKGRETVKKCFALIEGKLEGQLYAVGKTFTVVDGYLLVFYRWGNLVGFEMETAYPNYTKLVNEVVQRDAVKKTIEAEGIGALRA